MVEGKSNWISDIKYDHVVPFCSRDFNLANFPGGLPASSNSVVSRIKAYSDWLALGLPRFIRIFGAFLYNSARHEFLIHDVMTGI